MDVHEHVSEGNGAGDELDLVVGEEVEEERGEGTGHGEEADEDVEDYEDGADYG